MADRAVLTTGLDKRLFKKHLAPSSADRPCLARTGLRLVRGQLLQALGVLSGPGLDIMRWPKERGHGPRAPLGSPSSSKRPAARVGRGESAAGELICLHQLSLPRSRERG